MATKYPPSSLEVEIAAVATGGLLWLVSSSPVAGVAGALVGVLLFLRRYLDLERTAHPQLQERVSRVESAMGIGSNEAPRR